MFNVSISCVSLSIPFKFKLSLSIPCVSLSRKSLSRKKVFSSLPNLTTRRNFTYAGLCPIVCTNIWDKGPVPATAAHELALHIKYPLGPV